MGKVCINCRRPEEDHCPGFETRAMPVGCVCDEGSWGLEVTPVCDSFESMSETEKGYCLHCEHNRECHDE